ncbi:hypothetical protein [Schumannella sp. 10F1B-5-1]|uniref:hypothetical protein n=1 Tax=Schumannella sp. 10F1B-5-1 TaxID=2590780 RepID=UPI00113181F3|nr:hypothetical protein [Schumannella sp. 10F1B-5-1]TPW72243.1 hypothetical protein FJ658_08185 [Schumannella sp. 10F1B-5-1]
MASERHGLRRSGVDEAARERLIASHVRLGMDGLLREGRRDAGPAGQLAGMLRALRDLGERRPGLGEHHPARGSTSVSGAARIPRPRRMSRIRSQAPAAVQTLRWSLVDDASQRWWPQGIEVRPVRGDVLLVSWFAQQRRGTSQGARVSVIDLRARRPRYWHVLLVEATSDGIDAEPDAVHGAGSAAAPAEPAAATSRISSVEVHAGGIAWTGDRLLVAASGGGIREFRLGDLLLLDAETARRETYGHRLVLPQHRSYASLGARGRLRFSFLSLESGGSSGGGSSDSSSSDAGEGRAHLVAGEFSNTEAGGRLLRLPLDDAALLDGCGGDAGDEPDRIPIDEVHASGLRGLQGAVVVDGTWMLTSTNGDRRRGDLWVGSPDTGFERHREVLPSGPEDIAVDRARHRLWTHSEWPWRRRVVALDLDRWMRGARPGARRT